jgi:ribosomal protein S18 acetylase RimI-like enzyme
VTTNLAEGVQRTDDVLIRVAAPAEYERVGDLTYAAYAADGLLESDHGYTRELRDAAGRAGDADLLVALDPVTGTVLGTVTFCLPGTPHAEVARVGEAEFRMLAVAPEARGRGVGEALVRDCLARARRYHCERVVISTRWNMRPAHRLYQRLGFVREPSRDWWPVPDMELICYKRDL